MLQFSPNVGRGETPLDDARFIVALLFPRRQLARQFLRAADAAIQALTGQNAQLDIGNIQ